MAKKETSTPELREVNDIIAEFMELTIESLFPNADNAPWEELNEAYATSQGTWKGTQFEGNDPKNTAIKRLFSMQLCADLLAKFVEEEEKVRIAIAKGVEGTYSEKSSKTPTGKE